MADNKDQLWGHWSFVAFSNTVALPIDTLSDEVISEYKEGINARLEISNQHFKYSKTKNEKCQTNDTSIFQTDKGYFCGSMPYSNSGLIQYHSNQELSFNEVISENVGNTFITFGMNYSLRRYFWKLYGDFLEIRIDEVGRGENGHLFYYFFKQPMLLF